MSLLPLVTSNDGTGAIDRIMDEVGTAEDEDLQAVMYEKALVHLKATNERLWFSTQLKLARGHVMHRDAGKLAAAVDALHDSCRTPEGADDPTKATYLMDVYALRIQLCGITKEFDAIRQYYDAVNGLQKVAIADPRVMGTIRETFGEMHMSQKNWKQAFDEFFESFKNYQAAGNMRAVRCLKCVLLANMIAGIEVNPFDSQEAKAYENDPQITAMVQLRRAYDQNDISQFQRVLSDPKAHIQDDPFMLEYLSPLMRNFRGQVVLKIVKPYKVVRLSYLAKELNVDGAEAEQIVAQLILDGRLVGHIDQASSVLHLSAKTAQESGTFEALRQAAEALRRISAKIHERASEGRAF